MPTTGCVALSCLTFVLGYTLGRVARRRHPDETRWNDQATFATLHLAAMAAPALRTGLTRDSARKAVRHLHALLGTHAVAITSTDVALAWDGPAPRRSSATRAPRSPSGRAQVFAGEPYGAVVVPLTVDGTIVGALAVFDDGAERGPGADRHRGGPLGVGPAGAGRARLLAAAALEAEMRALRAQISPHFVYNALTTIASFVRTDPDRARELLLDFADFARYALSKTHDFTTLADELSCVDRYLLLERARFGDKAALQPAGGPGGAAGAGAVPVPATPGRERHQARHAGPRRHRRGPRGGARRGPGGAHHRRGRRHRHGPRAGQEGARRRPDRREGSGIGLANVDLRMRQIYGDGYGLVVETALGAGTRVRLRVPKAQLGHM